MSNKILQILSHLKERQTDSNSQWYDIENKLNELCYETDKAKHRILNDLKENNYIERYKTPLGMYQKTSKGINRLGGSENEVHQYLVRLSKEGNLYIERELRERENIKHAKNSTYLSTIGIIFTILAFVFTIFIYLYPNNKKIGIEESKNRLEMKDSLTLKTKKTVIKKQTVKSTDFSHKMNK
ncbi:hypothetical protein VB776_18300 [Arcicella sp. DC2W]|uniref:Uncharacterized protein n=1 Tax=Arcicella gelida TaxID=2984195 RepID=A0ABU5S8T9_9BACT|nr:hypothetical protein [Arcicella sp. DC2W]MEA5404893.1 hypothetical protein [Arcicella sp. DC2W]